MILDEVTDKDSETINESFDVADIDPNDLLSFCLETDDTEDRTEEESPEFTPSEFKLPHPPGRQIRCKKGCTRCTGCVCKKAGLKCSTECECGSECKNLQKDSNHFQNGWDLNGKFSKVEIKAPQRSGPTNIPENFTLLKSANLIWDESIIEHVWCRTNWKKEYCETFETKLSKHKEWQEAKTKHYLAKKTTKRKYVQYVFSENEIPPLIEDETPFTLPEPKFEDFDSFYRRNQMNQTPNHFKKEEIRGFLQVCQLMSIAPIPNYANYWTGSGMDHALYACKLIQRFMSRRRFQEIHTFLSSEPQIIEDKINSNSRKYWLCVREVSVDEIIAAFKGKVRFKQYIPLKPHKYGLKYYALSDSTGYIYAFWLYQGKESRYTHNPTSIVLDCRAYMRKHSIIWFSRVLGPVH
ncbi:hypothetical protein FDP41_010905 [Naegleria fowleri]|uniref:PiggyBac transposable element-derived protein domain-containing protein n=1 Tax=Naegleria fowleri TaxID=5763 RepID=A0A6A5C598_NAEFO|nr:uncharacterized protein FDP41_010905 [Naegleria fowleri]KAF0982926.1 hypothetical protein FDP41_010905 [Naegleria fowleri]